MLYNHNVWHSILESWQLPLKNFESSLEDLRQAAVDHVSKVERFLMFTASRFFCQSIAKSLKHRVHISKEVSQGIADDKNSQKS